MLEDGHAGVFRAGSKATMSYPFVHAKPLNSATEVLEKYILDVSRRRSANGRTGLEAVVTLRKPLSMDELNASLFELRQRSHSNAWEVVEINFYGPSLCEPPQKSRDENASDATTDSFQAEVENWRSDIGAWSEEMIRAWAEECILWLEKCALQAVIVAAALFQYGKMAVVRCIILPIRSDGLLGWTRLQWEIHSGAGARFDGDEALAQSGRRLQNAYRKHVLERFNLRHRGAGAGASRNRRPLENAQDQHVRDTRPDRINSVEIEEADSPSHADVQTSTQVLNQRDQEQMLYFALSWCVVLLDDDRSSQLEDWANEHLQLSLRDSRLANAKLLGQAAARGQLDRVQALFDLGIGPNIAGPDRITALMRAAAAGNRDVIAVLVAEGADVTRRDLNGKDCADYAREAGHLDLADELDQNIQSAREEKDRSEPS